MLHRTLSALAATAAALALSASPALAQDDDDDDDGGGAGQAAPQGGVQTGAGGMADQGPGWALAGLAAGSLALALLGCGGDPAPERTPAAERSAQAAPSDRDRPARAEAAGGERATSQAESEAANRGPTASPAETAEREPNPSQAGKEAADPRRIEVPAIGVSARVIELGLNADRTLEVPKRYEQTGWWKGGPEPGERGAAVIAGHVDSKTGPAVFHRLEQLRAGDEIRVQRTDDTQARFVVRRLERHPKDDFPTREVYARTDEPTLRLVTCSGDFDASTGHYVDATIVLADAAWGAH